MRNPTKSFLSLAAASVAVASLCMPVLAWVQELSESEHRALGGELKHYLDVQAKPDAKAKDKDKAKEELLKALEKIGKKRVEKDGDAVRAALALHVDLGRAVALANDYKNAPGGKVSTESFEIRPKEKQEYALWLPPTYRATTYMPLILVFPPMKDGKPMVPAQFLQEYWIESEVRDKAIIAVVSMPELAATWNQLDGGLGIAMRTFGVLTERFAIDRDRVYLLGRGEGVAPAVALASMYPQRFAAVVGTAGDAGKTAPANFQNLPTYFQGAGGDATGFEQKNKELGYDNCTISAAATVAEMWAWMQSHPRIANPAKVTLAPGAPAPSKAYWVEIQPTEGQGILITAEADRATNTVSIKASAGVPTVIIYLNDALVDLSKPVKVVLNGREQTDVIPRSVDDFLTLLNRGTCDSGMVYTARKAYDIPE